MCLCVVDVLRKPAVVVGQGSGHLSVRDETRFHGVRLPGSRLLDAARQSLRHAILQAGLSVAPAPTFQSPVFVTSVLCPNEYLETRLSANLLSLLLILLFLLTNLLKYISECVDVRKTFFAVRLNYVIVYLLNHTILVVCLFLNCLFLC